MTGWLLCRRKLGKKGTSFEAAIPYFPTILAPFLLPGSPTPEGSRLCQAQVIQDGFVSNEGCRHFAERSSRHPPGRRNSGHFRSFGSSSYVHLEELGWVGFASYLPSDLVNVPGNVLKWSCSNSPHSSP